MSRRIEHSASYAAGSSAVYAALTDPSYWRARIDEVGGPGASLNGIEDTEDGVEVRLTQGIAEEHLPSIVKKIRSGNLSIERTVTWAPLTESASVGRFTAHVSSTPITMHGTHSLRGDDSACAIETVGEAEVSVPIIGGKIEQIIAENIHRLLVLEKEFTEQWLTQH